MASRLGGRSGCGRYVGRHCWLRLPAACSCPPPPWPESSHRRSPSSNQLDAGGEHDNELCRYLSVDTAVERNASKALANAPDDHLVPDTRLCIGGDAGSGSYPLIVFAHGLGGSPQEYSGC